MDAQHDIEMWQQCLDIIKDNIGEEHYNVWFRPIKFNRLENNRIYIVVPSDFCREFIEENYAKLIISTIHRVFGDEIRLAYEVRIDNSTVAPKTITVESTGISKQTLVNEAPNPKYDQKNGLKPELRFDNFIVDKSNEMVYTVGNRIAKGARQFNPLFIHGGCGVGKTHIANAIGLKYKENYPHKRVLYTSAQEFELQYRHSHINNCIPAFLEFYLGLDCLIIDDFQSFSIGNKPGTINTFFHIFNEFISSGKQVIACCDRPIHELKDVENRIVSRFKSGLTAEIHKPERGLIQKALMTQIQEFGLELNNDVIDTIIKNAPPTFREIRGFLLSVSVLSMTQSVTSQDIRNIVQERKLYDEQHNVVTANQVCNAVCDIYDVTMEQLCSKSKIRTVSEPRQIAMYLIRTLCSTSLPEIGKIFGRDHSTVVSACNTIADRIDVDKSISSKVTQITNNINDYID